MSEWAGWEDTSDEESPNYDTADVPAWVRRTVLERDRYRCRACGEEHTEKLNLHHVLYRSQGGTHHPDNLVTLCIRCHRKVHDKLLTMLRVNGAWYFHDRNHWRNRPR